MGSSIKREVFVVDEGFQLKYSILLATTGLLVSFLVGYVFYSYVNAHDNALLVAGLNQSKEAVLFLERQRKLLMIKIAAVGVTITFFMFLVGLVFSSRVSGAVFSIRRSIDSIHTSGDLSVRFRVRKKDELKELVGDLNKLMNKLDAKYGEGSVSKKDND
ncbi:MAG TPA: hypothetical protein PK443_00740 [bacterium]|nr:hypothetical protein [bacterium]